MDVAIVSPQCSLRLCCLVSHTPCPTHGNMQHHTHMSVHKVQVLCATCCCIRYAAYWKSKLKENKMDAYMTVIRNHTSQSVGKQRMYATIFVVGIGVFDADCTCVHGTVVSYLWKFRLWIIRHSMCTYMAYLYCSFNWKFSNVKFLILTCTNWSAHSACMLKLVRLYILNYASIWYVTIHLC